MQKRRVHIQLVLNPNEQQWYDSLSNRAEVFRNFINKEVELYQLNNDSNY
jgi:hypothetical protein